MIKMKECESAIQKALREERSSLLIDEAYRICNLHHIPTPKFRVVTRLQEAVERANEIGYPVALKILSPQILHKSDVGGVILNVEDENELRTEYEKLIAEVNRREPSAKVAGVLVEKKDGSLDRGYCWRNKR